ncbi:unnamed protein product [Coffea canephora]|uniref:Uncharacterized protein n=1 Tax=Coffea canephora TaxID=49390 RepID=A0A068TW40_COFCA|nr:unnamed protein product [Coffea canephora]
MFQGLQQTVHYGHTLQSTHSMRRYFSVASLQRVLHTVQHPHYSHSHLTWYSKTSSPYWASHQKAF